MSRDDNHAIAFIIGLIFMGILMAIFSGCARPAAKPTTLEGWMQVPREQRLKDPDYIECILRELYYGEDTDYALPRAIETVIQRKEKSCADHVR